MGEIYAAEDARLGRQVALKVLYGDATRNAASLQRFQVEARAASVLNHPNIVTIYDFGDAGGLHYIATELIEGKTLREMEALTVAQVLSIAVQMAGALAAAHAAGIAHRDIKPENVMVRPDGYIKILDFGLAKLSRREAAAAAPSMSATVPGLIMGTPRYMSPEQARGTEADARSDIFSMGAVLYEMLAGRPAFGGEFGPDVLAAVVRDTPPPLGQVRDGIPEGLSDAIERCLQKDRTQRFQNGGELLAALLEVKAAIEAGAAKSGRARRMRKLAGTAAAVAVLVGAAVFAAVRLQRQPQSFEVTRLTKLPLDGTLFAVSPNGRYTAQQTTLPNGMRGIRVALMGESPGVEVAPPARVAYYVVTFSPDERHLFYSTHPLAGSGADELFRVPVLGGQPQKILEGDVSGLSISRDGSHMAYARRSGEIVSLMVSSTDGSDARALLVSKEKDAFHGLDWSQNGKEIFYAEGTRPESGSPVAYLEKRTRREFPRLVADLGPNRVYALISFPDGRGLGLNAADPDTALPQLWYLSLNGGLRRITHDVNEYQGLVLTRDGKQMATNQVNRLSELWVVDADRKAAPLKITEAGQRFDAPVWSYGGSIVSPLWLAGSYRLRAIAPGGNGQHDLATNGRMLGLELDACPDRDDVVFPSRAGGATGIWRLHTTTGETRQITFGANDRYPQCLAGGRVLYRSEAAGKILKREVSLEGGAPSPTDIDSLRQRASPDGRMVLQWELDEKTQMPGTVVRGTNDGKVTARFPYTVDRAAWEPHGRGFAFAGAAGDISELWYQSLPGGQPRMLTHFGSDAIYGLQWSRDGKRLVCSRGRVVSEVVLIQDVR